MNHFWKPLRNSEDKKCYFFRESVSFLAPLGDSFLFHSNRVYRDFWPVTHSPWPVFWWIRREWSEKTGFVPVSCVFVSLFLGRHKHTHWSLKPIDGVWLGSTWFLIFFKTGMGRLELEWEPWIELSRFAGFIKTLLSNNSFKTAKRSWSKIFYSSGRVAVLQQLIKKILETVEMRSHFYPNNDAFWIIKSDTAPRSQGSCTFPNNDHRLSFPKLPKPHHGLHAPLTRPETAHLVLSRWSLAVGSRCCRCPWFWCACHVYWRCWSCS